MKRYITAAALGTGSYLLDREGKLIPVDIHSPSTTYINRGLAFLSVTDAEFLYRIRKVTENEALQIVLGNFNYFLQFQLDKKEGDMFSILDISRFMEWSEMKYAPTMKDMFRGTMSEVSQLQRMYHHDIFEKLTHKFYPWLLNNYVKISVIGNNVEFRISSEDGFDWNSAIVDHVLTQYQFSASTRFNILRESSSGYIAYFLGATLNEVLERDKVIMSSIILDRVETDGGIKYIPRRNDNL